MNDTTRNTNAATTRKPRLEAEPAYENAVLVTQDLLTRIQELLYDMPAPGVDERPITWSDVATINQANGQLAEVMQFLESATR